MKINFEGVFPAVTTKFHADESLDLPLMEKNIQAQIEAGANGIILGGTLGEASTLSQNEKMELLSFVKRVCSGRIPVLINISESRTATALQFVKAAEPAGADGFMCLPPLRYLADVRET